ncbi:ATP6V0B (predicted) [Pycnogonum litorale]
MFRRSPLKNDSLRTNTKSEFGQELGLILDSKTRLNSLSKMLDRFLKLKRSIAKSLLDFDELECNLAEGDYEVISEVVQALEPFKAGADMICRREATLITADGTFKFMIQELE